MRDPRDGGYSPAAWPRPRRLALSPARARDRPRLEVPVRPAPARRRRVVEPAPERAAPPRLGDREAHVDRRRARARGRHADERHAARDAVPLPRRRARDRAAERAGHRGAAPVPHVRRLPADRLRRGLDRRRVRRLGPQADLGDLPVAPAKGLEIVPTDHVVYKSFYLLDKPLGRLAIAPAMEARDPRRPARRRVRRERPRRRVGARRLRQLRLPVRARRRAPARARVPHGREPRDVRAVPRLQGRPGPRAVHHEAPALEARRRRDRRPAAEAESREHRPVLARSCATRSRRVAVVLALATVLAVRRGHGGLGAVLGVARARSRAARSPARRWSR